MEDKAMTHVTHILGGWSPNIGNAFFQLGGYHVLKSVLPDATFSFINEKPGYPQYWNPRGGNPRDYFDMAAAVKSDYLVLMGPMFRPETMDIWGDSLEKIVSQGTQLIYLGIGAMRYEPEYLEQYRAFLKKFKPYLFVSRDDESFKKLGDLAQYAYNGIDLAFFIPDFYPLAGFANLPPYVAINFDKIPEPEFTVLPEGSFIPESQKEARQFTFNNQTWIVNQEHWRTRLARRSRYLMLLESVLFKGNQAKMIGEYPIIRSDHRYTPIIGRRTYRYPNVMVNDTPYPYFEIYGNAELILSDRLHACVMGLAYGRTAMVFSESPRLRLLERFNIPEITSRPMSIDLLLLKTEKTNLVDFLKLHLT
jgi:hypothetical protein